MTKVTLDDVFEYWRRSGPDDTIIDEFLWGFLSHHYGKTAAKALFVIWAAGEEGVDIYTMATHPLLKDGSPTLEANELRLRVAICTLRKKMRETPYADGYEIQTLQKNNMEIGRYVLTKKTP
jgi:hypothetical protein